ncbi:PP2C family serine/threonine-protein phosphatase [Paenibacillus oceani]|uniref:Protein phosphatase 2C domain-containing protein n=1 Tax=Paenibacillus oceani TaxID=2772510 RepID=A0A927C8H1_9BACL|nr:PP2C family serine/threonine-protein phosphatase [Paenibacillus oceani]MBD2862043.1 protein phosphatase 2C domain-containing protein [Paenibacillus oceani]
MEIVHYSKPSPQKREGEDALILNPSCGIYGVLDGVTPMASFTDENGHNGAYLAANLFKAALEREHIEGSLTEAIAEANRELNRKMVSYGVDIRIKHELWSTCLSVAQVMGEGIRYAQLGDSMAVARYADGSVKVLTENRVNGISARAKAKRERDRQNGLHVEEESFFAELNNRMAYHRGMANTPEGYGVANGMTEAADYIQTGLVPAEGLTHLLLISDGMFHPDYSLDKTMELLLELGFDRYVEQVEAAEQAKQMRPDDRSAVLFRF